MKTDFFSIMAIMGLCFASAVMSSCKGGMNSNEKLLQVKEQDSLLEEELQTSPERALVLVDSLAAIHEEDSVRFAYYRALAYNKLGDKKKQEVWCMRALEGDVLQNQNVEYFYHACDMLSVALTYKDDYQGSLAVSQRGFEVAKEDLTDTGRYWLAVLLHTVGYSEMRLGRIGEAERNFSQAYIALKQLAGSSHQYKNVFMLARVSYNIVDAYTGTGQYDKAKAWIDSAEDALDMLAEEPECTRQQEEEFRGGLAIQRAMVMMGLGQETEADRAYHEALGMKYYANTDVGLIERAVFLEKAQRWEELKELMPRMDSLSKAWGIPMPVIPDEVLQQDEKQE